MSAARSRCGEATADGRLTVTDRHFGNTPVDMEMRVLFGKPPKMTRKVSRRAVHLPPFDVTDIDVADACMRVLRVPAVASRTSSSPSAIGRSGPYGTRPDGWALADAGRRRGGDRDELQRLPWRSLRNGRAHPAGVRRRRGLGAHGDRRGDYQYCGGGRCRAWEIKLSANWMAAAGHRGEDAKLFETVRAVSRFCQQAGLSIPVGKRIRCR